MKNSRLTNLFKLSSKVTVYIPSTVDVDIAVDTSEYVDKTAEIFSRCFGGATTTPAVGCWLSASGKIVKEKTTMVFAFCDTESLEKSIDEVIDLCYEIKEELKQESVAMEINGDMYFI